jgi:hypothetical protein
MNDQRKQMMMREMIFDDQLELSARNQGEPAANVNSTEEPEHQSEDGGKKEFTKATSHNKENSFSLNKYESKPELKAGQASLMQSETQMETAHFKKQGGGNADGRTNTDHTMKT